MKIWSLSNVFKIITVIIQYKITKCMFPKLIFKFFIFLHVSFTYYIQLIRKVTSLFKYTSVRTSFKSTYTIHHLIKPITNSKVQEHKKFGICELTCNKCKLSYAEQTNLIQTRIPRTRKICEKNTLNLHTLYIFSTTTLYMDPIIPSRPSLNKSLLRHY
jgi:hypothetical protein